MNDDIESYTRHFYAMLSLSLEHNAIDSFQQVNEQNVLGLFY
jgi:hypothetical protein